MRSLLLVPLALLVTSCREGDAPRAVADEGSTLLVFADITPSLSERQAGDVRELFHTIVQRATSDTAILAYSITKNAGGDQPFYEGTGLADLADVARITAAKNRLDTITNHLKDEYARIKGQGEKQTCILSSLAFATQKILLLREQRQRATIIYLSDMMEDCGNTPAGVPIILQKGATTYDPEQQLLKRITPQSTGLKGVLIRAILPGEVLDPVIPGLTTFWKAALARFGLDQEEVAGFTLWRNQLPTGLFLATP